MIIVLELNKNVRKSTIVKKSAETFLEEFNIRNVKEVDTFVSRGYRTIVLWVETPQDNDAVLSCIVHSLKRSLGDSVHNIGRKIVLYAEIMEYKPKDNLYGYIDALNNRRKGKEIIRIAPSFSKNGILTCAIYVPLYSVVEYTNLGGLINSISTNVKDVISVKVA